MRRLSHDDRGVSVLVSAVLVLGLLVVVSGTYTATILPARVEEREAQHLQQVDETYARIASAIASDHAKPLKFSSEVSLGTELESWFVTRGSEAHLYVHQEGFYQRIECRAPRLLTLGQSPAPGAQFASGLVSKTDVAYLEFARLKLESYRFRFAEPTKQDWVTIEAIHAGRVLGRFQAVLDARDSSLRVRVTDADGTLSTDQLVESGLPNPIPSYLIDSLDPLYGFNGLVAGMPKPWTLRFSSSTGTASIFALYRSPSGAPGLVGAGAPVADPWVESARSDALVYDSEPTRFVGQTYALEGGTFLLDQPEGEILRTGSIAAADGSTRWLSLSGLELDGHGSRRGSHSVQLEFSREPVGRKIVTCENPKWNATTPYPEAWANAWSRISSGSGVPVTISTGPQWVVAQLKGSWFIEWAEGRIQVDFRP